MNGWLQDRLSQLGLPVPGATPDEGKSLRILLVDDSPMNLDVLRLTLAELGHELLMATDGETALELARQMHPQIIILDVVMPGLDGFAVCE